MGFTGCYKHHVLSLIVAWCKQSGVQKSNWTHCTPSKVQFDPCNDRRTINRKDVGCGMCFFKCLAVEHEWDEASSSLVSVKDITRCSSPPRQLTCRLYALWQETREDFEDVGPHDFPCNTREVFDM